MVSNAPRVHASDRAPAFAAPPFAMAASRDVVSGASARAVRPPVSARACLEHLCRALASLGVGVVPTEDASRGSRDRPRRALTAETLRRAKFDHPDASAPLWRAIHDLFLVCAAGFPNPSVAADALARVRGDADDVEDATCAALARHRLAEAGYPRARDLESLPPRDGRSRPLLLALAWAVHRADVFARAHADAHAPNLASAAPGASRSPLPPYPPDSAASPAAARAAAARALAEERAYVDDARAALDACRDEHDAVGDAGPSSSASAARLGRRREPLPLAARAAARVRAEAARDAGVRAQTPIFAQRLWQTFSHVEALERARASRRVRLRDARREFAASFGDPSSAPARPPLPSSAYEVLLSRDADARGAHAAAMEATMEATRAASDAVSAATTFYAWVESALALEDERRDDDDDDEDESSFPGHVNGHDVNGHDRSRVLGDAIRAVASAARRAGPALRSRRRGVEAIANAWSRARRRAEEDHDEAERLAKRSERAANGLPTFDTFREGGTSERPRNVRTIRRPRNVRTIRRPRIVRDTREEFLPRGFGAGDVRGRDAAARGRRGGARRARSDASKGDERDARRVPARVRRTRTFRGGRRRVSIGARRFFAGDARGRGGASRRTRASVGGGVGANAASRAGVSRDAGRGGVRPGRGGGPRARGGHGVVRGRTVVRADETDRTRREGGDAGTVCVCEHVARTRRGA